MLLCNDTMTVFNARAGDGEPTYAATVLRGVSWREERAAAADAKGGRAAARRVVVRVPEDVDAGGKAYVGPEAYRGAGDVSGLFTLRVGDVIAPGDCGGEGLTPAALRARGEGCAAVTGVTDNRRAPNARHWKLVSDQ